MRFRSRSAARAGFYGLRGRAGTSRLETVMRRRDFFAASVIGAFALGSTGAACAQAPRLKAVATFSVLGDFVKNVGGDRLEPTMLVGPGGDAHVFAPSPADARPVGDAAVVVVKGPRFGGWVGPPIKPVG